MTERVQIQTRTEHEGGQVTTVTHGHYLVPVIGPNGEPTNESRRERARCAMRAYEAMRGDAEECPETFAADLLADLLHLAGGETVDFDLDRALRCARDNYQEEAAEETEEAAG